MPKKIIHNILLGILIALTAFSYQYTMAQYSNVEFGKNRVQYKQFKWQYYETDNFRIYFYQGGQDIGKYVIQAAEKNLSDINELLDYKLSKKLDLIVYNDISDMHQTNIGIKEDVEHVSGSVQLKNNRLFVYFNGKHSDLDRQIREGIARLFINRLSGGNGFQELVQNSLLVDFPYWFSEGLVRYAGEPWNTTLENKLRSGILSGRYADLSKLSKEEQAVVGQSIWAFLQQNFSKDVMGNLLYLAKVNRSVEVAFSYATRFTLGDFLKQWYVFHKEKFEKETAGLKDANIEDEVLVKKKKAFEKYEPKISPNGRYIAYAVHYIGKWKVMVYDTQEETTRTLISGGFKTYNLETDLSTPMLAWEPKGKRLSVIYERKDQFYIANYETEKFTREEKPEPFRKFQKIFDFSYAQDSRNIVMSAMQNGQIDIFTYYTPTNRVENLTKDFYNDLHANYVELGAKRGVLFVSNRPNDQLVEQRLDTILPNGTFDVFFYDYNNPFQKLAQVTFTPQANESYPQQFTDSTYTFLSDYSGKNNQYLGSLKSVKTGERIKYVYTTTTSFGKKDSVVLDKDIALQDALAEGITLKEIIREETVPVVKTQGVNFLNKNYSSSIHSISLANKVNKQLESFKLNKEHHFIVNNKSNALKNEEQASQYMLTKVAKARKEEQLRKAKEQRQENNTDTIIVPKRQKIFQSKFDTWDNLSEFHAQALENEGQQDEESSDEYKFSRTRQYFLKFMTEDVSLGLNSSNLINQYQPFVPGTPAMRVPDISGMISFGITDLFENHKLYGGFSLDFSGNTNPQAPPGFVLPFRVRIFDNNQFFLTYENLKKRWDKKLTYYRRNFNQVQEFVSPRFPGFPTLANLNIRTNVVETQVKYPFNMLNSLRLSFGFRNDRNIIKSTDFITLTEANSSQNWLYTRAEFVHDHTLELTQNIRTGFKFNGFVEFHKEFPTREDTVLNQSVQLPIFNNSYMINFGFDARHYQKVYKTVIWANRLAYNSSIGTRKMIYYLGATDGILFPGFNDETSVNQENNYAYQSAAVNMRGFQQNIRNGNSYMVWNTELRIPIFSAFRKKPLRSNFLKHFQLLAFYDLGTAWEGITPFSNDNITQITRQNSPENPTAIARVDEYRQPIVMAVGTGVRFEFLGYFIRADYAWGYDTGKFNNPRFQVSLGLDF